MPNRTAQYGYEVLAGVVLWSFFALRLLGGTPQAWEDRELEQCSPSVEPSPAHTRCPPGEGAIAGRRSEERR